MNPLATADKITRLDVVIKVTERCNINCTYCYMFNKGNDDYATHPAYIDEPYVKCLARFLQQGVIDFGIETIVIILHGGEPMMIKQERFDFICTHLRDCLESFCQVRFVMQTNAILVDDGWIELIAKHRIGVGVSIDGPAKYNDLERVDHKGRGTHAAVINGLRRLQAAANAGFIARPGALCVIEPSHDAREIYRHLRDDLSLREFNFLLPIETHDSELRAHKGDFTRYLTDLFDEWTKDDDPTTKVRMLSEPLAFFSIGDAEATSQRLGAAQVISVGTNGDLGEDDSLKPLNLRWDRQFNIRDTSLKSFLNSDWMRYLKSIQNSIPDDCHACCWQNICKGGANSGRMINRYKEGTDFNNRSVYCEDLRYFYARTAAYFLRSGGAVSALNSSLEPPETSRRASQPIPANLRRVVNIALALVTTNA